MKKITAYVTLPVTTSITMAVDMEIDENLDQDEQDRLILEAARDRAAFQLKVDDAGQENGIDIGEEVSVHAEPLNRGNVCKVACAEPSVDFVEEN